MEGARPFDAGQRLTPPAYADHDTAVTAPPEAAETAANPLIRFLPIVTALATVGAMAVAYHARSAIARNPAFMIFPLMMLTSAIATVLPGADRRRGETNTRRADYLRYLSELRADALRVAAAQHDSLLWSHPDPDTLWTLVGGRRMWERRAGDADFCQVRIGLGAVTLATRMIVPEIAQASRVDPVGVAALQRFLDTHSSFSGMPAAVALRGPAVVRVSGDPSRARAVVRALVCQLAVAHDPSDVLIAAVAHRTRHEWDWLKWLPHNQHPQARDDVGPARMVYDTAAAARAALDGVKVPQLLVVVDGGEDPQWDDRDLTTVRIDTREGEPVAVSLSGNDIAALPDELSNESALLCARRLAGYRTARLHGAAPGTTWQDLVGIADVAAFSPSGHCAAKSLRVPVGTTAAGTTVELDINEAAAGGMGPHGLCIGATGSGKSEFLRTVALGMIVGHPSDRLNLILIDFKGGATFSGLESAPHVAAVITNLSDKAALVARMRDALMGELNRRQELLRAAGNVDGIAAYRRRRQVDAAMDPLPVLFIMVDEFSELLSQQPDFAEVFVAIGRLGRSLGVHLLLASQRLDEGRLRGLESHLSYRVCLKTLSVNESRAVLGTSEAYELPAAPGVAYLRVGTEGPVRFQTAFVSGSSVAALPRKGGRSLDGPPLRVFTTAPVGATVRDGDDEIATGPTVLDAIVERFSGAGPPAHQVWLPPLSESPDLGAVLAEVSPRVALTAPIGVVDRPFEQRRTSLVVDLSRAAGNVAVVGAPQSGKSTCVRTLVIALATTHDPRTVQFYCLDFGGGALASLRDHPHVGSVAGRTEPERARRTIARLVALVRSREVLFREHGIESVERYRLLKATDDPACDQFGDVFLVIDGWLGLQREIETAETSVTSLAVEGLSYGVHVVISASRWADIRPALRDQIGTRIELRLGDPADSELDRRRAQQVPRGTPGRGLTHDGMQMAIALPRIDGSVSGDGWTAPPIPVLPRSIDQDSLATCEAGVTLGVEEVELRTVAIDFDQERHLIVLGDAECGKTATLRTICRQLMRTPAATRLLAIDPRRSLTDVVEVVSLDAFSAQMPRLLDTLRARLPGSGGAPLPEIYMVIDDYDALAAVGENPLAPLVELLPHSRDIGLHLVVARRSNGAARAMYEPLLAGLRDAGCATLLMSGNPDEGLAVGPVRPTPLPPGRGVLITRRGESQLIQVGWSPAP
ncbi:type VII secretion protein EccCb [Candidatus Mycobacterium wuenschmannii]|uniref:Type VII secretion protein EccCb n=1 Tax=Candidatus Mycobacterium wuenschmannii TaxID=3027808 RepID=A0ABY8VXH5_9MYCO|nr:type VII secretion protein EccCb [Candidatus Mycobacterium wuenschmannii]WIM87636.1 type VII secretion protein EccCb [Candidatus Mycobacterium wuenschmannii]